MLTCRPRARASEGWLSISGFSFDGTAEVRAACSADFRRTGTAERAAEGKRAGTTAIVLTGTADDSLTGAAEGRGTVTAAVLLTGTADDSLTGAADDSLTGAADDSLTGAADDSLTGAADDSLTGAADGDAVGADGQLVADESAAKSAD
jgi:hypothetical protein